MRLHHARAGWKRALPGTASMSARCVTPSARATLARRPFPCYHPAWPATVRPRLGPQAPARGPPPTPCACYRHASRRRPAVLQAMFQSSMAILRSPRVETFEAHERDDLKSATIYVAVAALISGVLGAITYRVHLPYLQEQAAQMQEQFGGDNPFGQMMAAMGQQAAPSMLGGAVSNVITTLIGFFIFLGLAYLLGRGFGGTGVFGELAYDISLFYAPLSVAGAILNLIGIGPLACLTGLGGLALFFYQLFLTYVGIQSGLNLPKDKALWVVILLGVIGIVVITMFAAAVAAFLVLVGLASGAAGAATP
ncbi:MAG: YIP1 family protein [Chloroflexi bacterium CFX6]|nr:YIP1 family protein [Chloroflexi bacterium CFX6]